jgi:transglutaminase-like putative cysteine protease
MELTLLAADRELALSPLNPPEIMEATFIEPSRPIRKPRSTARAVYTLSVADGTLDDLPSTSSQRAERIDERTQRLEVRDEPAFPEVSPPDPNDLAPSSMLNADDPQIEQLLNRARPVADADPAARAEAMRRFVNDYVEEKSLSVGLASASEVARTRVGDCTEHAVLLAALLRADGIPSRVAGGLVYAEDFIGSRDIFAYHMWTRAWIQDGSEPGRWVDLDATLGPQTPYDATHIALDVSSMSEEETFNAMLALVPVIGRLEIAVDDVDDR